jgi:hypothetical protein
METQPTDDTQIPAGYRVVAVASDTWVLIAPGGARVARYFGSLELRRAARRAGAPAARRLMGMEATVR